MGKPVTLDSDDVEVLLNAAAAIRHVENALDAVRQDPAMIRIHKSGKIGQALDRANRARAEAIKDTPVGPPPNWLPSPAQMESLGRLAAAGPRGIVTMSPGDYYTLRDYGLCVAGQANCYVNWADKTQEMVGPLTDYRFKITERGLVVLKHWSLMAEPECKAIAAHPKEIEHGQN